MLPFIYDGDVVTIAPLAARNPRLGDAVAFVHPEHGRLVVHRVVAAREEGYLIQGDNACDGSDGPVPHDQILGCVTRIERDGRRVWLGFGPERRAVALLSRAGLLAPLCRRLGSLVALLPRRSQA
jgi:hypothetical protein